MGIRLLWVGQSPSLPTGFGRVSRETLSRLQGAGWIDDVLCVACEHPEFLQDDSLGFRYYPAPTLDKAGDTVQALAADYRPDVLVTFGDLWRLSWAAEAAASVGAAWAPYIPIDGDSLPSTWRPVVSDASRIAVTSEFSRRVMREFLGPEAAVTVDVIPHAVDPALFQPRSPFIAGRADARRFLIGCVARNQFRKNLPLLMEVFAGFARTRPDAVLYLHTDAQDPSGSDLLGLARRLGISGRCIFPPEGQSANDVELANLYRRFDVFVLPTMGEGFGIPVLEAMACGVPVIATHCSAMPEIVGDAGILVSVRETLYVGRGNIAQALANPAEILDALERLYENDALRHSLGVRAHERALAYSWESVARQWESTIASISTVRGSRPSAGTNRSPSPVAPLLGLS